MKLLDSNILIYSAKTEYSFLRKLFEENNVFISDISRLEVLGFHRITKDQIVYFSSIFSVLRIIPVSPEIIDEAIELRKRYNLSVGDSIISATTKIFKLILNTNNEDDFRMIKEISINNPLTNK